MNLLICGVSKIIDFDKGLFLDIRIYVITMWSLLKEREKEKTLQTATEKNTHKNLKTIAQNTTNKQRNKKPQVLKFAAKLNV